MRSFPLVSLGCGLLLLPFLFVESGPSTLTKANRYIGVKACKNCHSGDAKGGVFEKWNDGPHAKAFETLASPKAKEIAAKRNIEDPQKSDQCLKCHVTAFGLDKKEIKRGFKHENGVQCETCHGPGEDHFKVRFKESQSGGDPSPVAAAEINTDIGPEKCAECHNEESPTYKEFCFKERMMKIRHLDPRKERTEEQIKAIEERCADDCKVCAKDKGPDKDG